MNMKYYKIFSLIIIALLVTVALPARAASSTAVKNTTAGNFVFARNLSAGVVNADVKELQKYLNAHGFVVSKAGAGSTGRETTKFGAATLAALIKFQQANQIKPAAGYFGPLTRAFVNFAPVVSNVAATSTTAIVTKPNLTVIATTTIATTTPVKVNNWQIIAANTCTSWTYSDWSPCSPWHNQTRSILTSQPAGCSGGDYVLEQSCGVPFDLATSTVASNATSTIAAVLAAAQAGSADSGFNDLFLSAAFFDNGKNVGMSCKPWVNKVLGEATNGKLSLPFFKANQYSWDLNSASPIINRPVAIEDADRGDILQYVATDNGLPHTAIIVTKTPTGMVWIHSNWQKTNVVSVDFITYTYFHYLAGTNYYIYHIY
jgi:peptidoglycan hydrolase-like protein with peptidoglycan-binding domain